MQEEFIYENLSDIDIDKMMNYAEEIVPFYLGEDYIQEDNISLSQPIKVYNTSFYYVMVSVNNEIIAILKIGKNSDGFYSALTYDIDDSINFLYREGRAINIVNYNGNIYICDDMGRSYCIDESATSKAENAIEFNAPTQKISMQDGIEIDMMRYANEFLAANNSVLMSGGVNDVLSANSSQELSVSFVGNVQYNNGKWICWAACTAMALNCKQGRALTAANVADKVVNAGLSADGSVECINSSYSEYGYTPTYTSTAITGSEIYYYISTVNIPVQINIKSSSGIAHAVLIYGVELGQNQVKYNFIDPSRSTASRWIITYAMSPSAISTSFNYDGIGDNGEIVSYTTWHRTFR